MGSWYSGDDMSFESWRQRAVYVVQCRTAALANDLNVFGWRIRALPGWRDAKVQASRDLIARVVRERRRAGLRTLMPPV